VFNNMKISSRLVLSFSLLLLIMIALIISGIIVTNKNKAEFEDIIKYQNVRTQLANNMIDNARETAINIRGILLLKYNGESNEKMQKVVDYIIEVRERYSGNVTRLKELFQQQGQGESVHLIKAVASGDTARQMQDKLIELSMAGKLNDANAFMVSQAYPTVQQWIIDIDELIKSENEHTLLAYDSAKDRYANLLAFMVIFGVIAIVLAIGMAVFLTRSITIPLKVATDLVISRDLTMDISAYENGGGELGAMIRSFSREITERKLAEQEFNRLFEVTPELICTVGFDGYFKRLNPSWSKTLGHSIEELLSKPFIDFVHADDREATNAEAAKLAEGARALKFENRYRCKDGSYRWLLWAATPVTEDKLLYCVAHDITERKLAEQSLRLKNLVFDASIAANSIADLNGVITEANDTFLRVWGYLSKSEVIGKPLLHFINDPNEAVAIVTALNGTGKWEGEYTAKKKDGSTFIAYGMATTVNDENGKVIGYQSAVMDITERKKTEQELSIRNKIANIFLTAPDEQMYTDVLNLILSTMESKYGVFGYIDENGALVVPTMTRTVWDKCQVPDKDIIFPRDKWGDSIWPRAIKQKQTLYSNEPSARTPKGHIIIQRNISAPIIHHDQVIGMFQVANKEIDYRETDIQLLESIANAVAPVLNARLQRDRKEKERRRAEEKLKVVMADLERSNKELEQFAYVASHDLQEPLRMVSSYTQLLADRYKDKLDQNANDYINFAVDGANRMQRLIQDLLSYSRVTTRGKSLAPVDTHAALGEAILNLQTAIKESGAMVTNDDLPTINADYTQLVQLFQNLIANGIKFHGATPPRIHISANKKGNEWVFSIKDNGIGIEPQYSQKIFVVFQRLHAGNKYPGTGIGLAICSRIVQRHGGRIWVESELGKGATFFFTLPAGKDEGRVERQTTDEGTIDERMKDNGRKNK